GIDARAGRCTRAGLEQAAAATARVGRNGRRRFEQTRPAVARRRRFEKTAATAASRTGKHVGNRRRFPRIRRSHECPRRGLGRGGWSTGEKTIVLAVVTCRLAALCKQIRRIAACSRIATTEAGGSGGRSLQIAEITDRGQLLPIAETLAPGVGFAVDFAAREALAYFIRRHRSDLLAIDHEMPDGCLPTRRRRCRLLAG